MPRASSAAPRRAPMRATGSPVLSAAWLEARSEPESAAPLARLTACSGSPGRIITIPAAATAMASAVSTAIGTIKNVAAGLARQGQARRSVLQPVSGLEDPGHDDRADDQE